jgi:large subunit ribosomal protein L29
MKAIEIRDLEPEEIELKVAELKEELFNLRFQLATGQLDNHNRLSSVKRDVARLRTALRQRQIEAYEAAEAAAASAGTTGGGDEA